MLGTASTILKGIYKMDEKILLETRKEREFKLKDILKTVQQEQSDVLHKQAAIFGDEERTRDSQKEIGELQSAMVLEEQTQELLSQQAKLIDQQVKLTKLQEELLQQEVNIQQEVLALHRIITQIAEEIRRIQENIVILTSKLTTRKVNQSN